MYIPVIYCLYVDDGIIKEMLLAPRLNLLTGAVTMLRDMALVQVMITSLLSGGIFLQKRDFPKCLWYLA